MEKSEIIEVNQIQWLKGERTILVSEAKLRGTSVYGHSYDYYRYHWVIENPRSGCWAQINGRSVLNRDFTKYVRTPIPRSEWRDLAFIKDIAS